MAQSVGYLLDTNIVIALIRANQLGKAIDQQYGLRKSLNRAMISVVTAGEMASLSRQFSWGQDKKEILQSLLNEIVWIDINHPEIIDAYGQIDHDSRARGRRMGKNDVWIAATAKVTKAMLLTTDTDFDHLEGTHLQREWIDPGTNP